MTLEGGFTLQRSLPCTDKPACANIISKTSRCIK
jgi:hypothetical protein